MDNYNPAHACIMSGESDDVLHVYADTEDMKGHKTVVLINSLGVHVAKYQGDTVADSPRLINRAEAVWLLTALGWIQSDLNNEATKAVRNKIKNVVFLLIYGSEGQ